MRQGSGDSGASGPKGIGAVLVVVGILGGVIAALFAGRLLAERAAATIYAVADGREVWTVVLTMAGPLVAAVTGLVLLRRARGNRIATGAAVVLVVVAFVFSVGFLPGKNDNGKRAASLDDAVGTFGAGDLFVGMGWALLPALLVTAWLVLAGFPERRTPQQRRAQPERPDRPGASHRGWIVRGALVVVLWAGLGALVVVLVDAPPSRSAWLAGTAAHLDEGEEFFADWDPGLSADLATVVSCDEAADALELDGRKPELDGCREALLVHATGRFGADRATSGDLTAVVLRVSSVGRLDELDGALDGVTLTAAHGLPAPAEDPLVTRAEAALALVVAAEDPGEIPHPDEGAEAVPLTRALAWTLIGEAQGIHLIPD